MRAKSNPFVFLCVFFALCCGAPCAKAQLFDSFTSTPLSPSRWQISDGYQNSTLFHCTWRASSVRVDPSGNGYLNFSLVPQAGNPPYAGAEVKTVSFYGYGLYEVNMKASPEAGVISSFFTYTGPSFGTIWDEIDIELGKFRDHSHTMLQCNYYANSVGGHEILVDLGFDPTAAFHTYAFDWEPAGITWYVDGVTRAQTPSGATLPVTPGKIYMNLWPPYGLDQWAGIYTGNPTASSYDWCKFTPASTSINVTPAAFSCSAVSVSRNGGVLTASGTLTNNGSIATKLQKIIITSRPPGGTNAGGPYDDFSGAMSSVTINPGQTITVNGSRTFGNSDPAGTWYGYMTYQDASGAWHDGVNFNFTVY